MPMRYTGPRQGRQFLAHLNLGAPRLRIVRAAFLAFAVVLVVRLFILQVIEFDTYQALASGQREVYRELFPQRGEILIKDGKSGSLTPLATNKDLYLIFTDPRLITDPEGVAKKLAPLLNAECKMQNEECKEGRYDELLARLSKKDDPYEPLARGVEEAVVEEIKKLALTGIDAAAEPVRFYPLKNIGAHVSGFVGEDEQGISGRYGIEGHFDRELAGTQGFFEGEKDVAGRWIPVSRRRLKPAVDGATVVLTLDRAIEYMACTKLKEAVQRHGATGGSVIIAEVRTGAILALCGAPDFDPNVYGSVEDVSVFANPATFGQYEPGSVFKVLTMAAALDLGELTPETTYEDTGKVVLGEHVLQNSDNKAHGVVNMTKVLEESLNTGAVFAVRKVGARRFADYVERFGLGKKTGIELDHESEGDISALTKRGEIWSATASFGQGIATTPLQLLQAVGAIANQGKMMKPYIVEELRASSGAVIKTEPTVVREVISPKTATLLSGMMVQVVAGTHGRRASVPGYLVAGKTGTAQIPRSNGPGYEPDAAIGTFVGFAPVENPKFVMVTRIDRPQGVKFAESTAAPLFGEIAKFLLNYFEIKPTRPLDIRN